MKNVKVLVIDDNKGILKTLKMLLLPEFDVVKCISNPNQIPHLVQSHSFDLILLDMNFSAGINTGNEGIYWLGEIKKLAPKTQVVMITAYGDVNIAVKSLKLGAADFVLKPWNNENLIKSLKSIVKLKFSQEKSDVHAEVTENDAKLLFKSSVMKDLNRIIEKVAVTDVNILITGENGTGKELIARQIHRASKRANKQLVTVDMGSISENLFESELFGHIKGAFTDARSEREGKIVAAHNGTLFLDEIGNLSTSLQAKLLAVLENRKVVPVGVNNPISIDIRLVCATNMNLELMVQEGTFREDLLYRINTIHIEVPPLRNRGEDVILIAKHFLAYYSDKYRKKGLVLSEETCDRFRSYHWSGNVRELMHAVEKAVILCENTTLQPNDFYFRPSYESNKSHKTLEMMEKQMIVKALDESEGNISLAAVRLGVTRQTLYNKIKKYGL